MVTLRRWTHADRGMLDGFNSPEMTAHFGGPETVEQLEVRHLRYLLPDIPGAMLVICDDEEVAVGAVPPQRLRLRRGDRLPVPRHCPAMQRLGDGAVAETVAVLRPLAMSQPVAAAASHEG